MENKKSVKSFQDCVKDREEGDGACFGFWQADQDDFF